MNEPKQAIEEFIGEQFIDWLNLFMHHEVQSWPIVDKINTAHSKPEKIKKFMLQSFLAADAFFGAREGDPGFLRFAIGNLSESDDPTAETALELLEKRRHEELVGHKVEKGIIQTTKREQWIRLLKAVGVTDEELDRAEPKEHTRNYIAELSEVYSTMDWQTAIGAYAAGEQLAMQQATILLNLIRNNFQLSEKDLEVLVHQSKPADRTNGGNILDKVVFDPEAKELVFEGVRRQLELTHELLDGLEKYLN
jgi:hypothetical protein